MRVRARAGFAVPMQHDPRKHVGEETVEVPNTSYYRRLVAVGDLVSGDAELATTESTPPADDAPPADTSTPNADQKPAKTQRKNRSAE